MSRKHLFALLLLLASLSPLCATLADTHTIRLTTSQAALVLLNEKEYCYIWIEGIDASKGSLWVHLSEKEDVGTIVETHRLGLNETVLITLEHTEIEVSLNGIIDRDTALLELAAVKNKESISIEMEELEQGGATVDKGSLLLMVSVVFASTFVSAAWCLTQGMTINASTTAETGKASYWGVLLTLCGYMILAIGFLTGLTLLTPTIVPLTVIVSVLIILGFVLTLFMMSGSGSVRGVRSVTGSNRS